MSMNSQCPYQMKGQCHYRFQTFLKLLNNNECGYYSTFVEYFSGLQWGTSIDRENSRIKMPEHPLTHFDPNGTCTHLRRDELYKP